jgi:hypothetical protein
MMNLTGCWAGTLAVFLLLSLTRSVSACTCALVDVRSHALFADVVFEGTSLDDGSSGEISDLSGGLEGSTQYTFAVSRYYKGYLGAAVTVHVSTYENTCNKPSYRGGTSALVFASWRDDKLVLEDCGGSAMSYEEWFALGPGAAPVEPLETNAEAGCSLPHAPRNAKDRAWPWALAMVASALVIGRRARARRQTSGSPPTT